MVDRDRKITRDDVLREIGPIEDLAVARIVATGATLRELVEAAEWLDDEDHVERVRGTPSTGRVEQILEIAADAIAEEEDTGPEPEESATYEEV